MTGPATTSTVWGRDDLTCPLPRVVIRNVIRHAWAHPWPGNVPLDCPRHFLDTTAITEPGRPTRLLISVDVGYHNSGWFANSDYESCLHVSISHPRSDRPKLYTAKRGVYDAHVGIDLEEPREDEVRAWGLVFYGAEHRKAWYEPPASVFDTYRAPGVAHLRLFHDRGGQPIIPTGEPYKLKPWPDGTSPAKVTEGRAGADVR